MSKLAEVGAVGNIDYTYGNNPTNSYPNVGYNNYNGNLESMRNNVGGLEMRNMYNSDPLSVQQARRFNEIVPHLVEGTDYVANKANQNYLNFANEMSNTFAGNSRAKSVPQLQSQQITPRIREGLNQDIERAQLMDITSRTEENDNRESFLFRPTTSENNVFNNYRFERDYRTGLIGDEKNRKQLTMVVVAILVGGFMLFMLFQLYLNQKKLEYMLEVYRLDPIHNSYYRIQSNQDEYI